MSARAWISFAAVSTLWGIPYLFIKVAVDDGVPPAFLAWVRVVLGAIVLLALASRAGVLGPLRGRWRWIAVFAVVEIAIPFPLIAAGEQHVSSSLAAIIIAAAPLFVALLAIRFDAEERATGARLAGLVLGLAGVVALVGIDVAGNADEMLGAAAILVSALCYAIGPMVMKRIEPTVFVPAHASPAKLAQITSYGARLERVDGSRTEVSNRAQEWALRTGTPYASHLWSPFFLAGMRTFAFELWEQLERRAPRNVVLPVGSGSLLLGAYEGFAALVRAGLDERAPRLFGVQATACAPLADAFERQSETIAAAPTAGRTIAEGIMVARPPRARAVLAATRDSGGTLLRVDDEEIERAQASLAARGLLVEPTSAAAEAGVRRLVADGVVDPGADTIAVLTGSGLKTLLQAG